MRRKVGDYYVATDGNVVCVCESSLCYFPCRDCERIRIWWSNSIVRHIDKAIKIALKKTQQNRDWKAQREVAKEVANEYLEMATEDLLDA